MISFFLSSKDKEFSFWIFVFKLLGNFAYIEEGKEVVFLPTTRDILHYSKEGFYLIPSAPHGFRK